LGLFIANRVIRQHGGTISVESEPKQGSKFHICLPKLKPVQPEMVHIPGESKTHEDNETNDKK
jgi:nitrogen-specific signal transduction histidine kinase